MEKPEVKKKKATKTTLMIAVIAIASAVAIYATLTWFMPQPPATTQATVDIKPDTLNLTSPPAWITAYITLPSGYNVSDINASSILLDNLIPAVTSRVEGDTFIANFDGIQTRNHIETKLYHMGIVTPTSVTLTITGEIDKSKFEASDQISVVRG
jgi:hypothetical protein